MSWREPRIAYRHKSDFLSQQFYLRILRWMKQCIGKNHQGMIALDVGCGEGYVVKLLNKMGYQAIGLDVSIIKRVRVKGIDLVMADGAKLPYRSSSFDLITCFETMEHVTEPECIVSEAHRVLREGGIFILTTPLKSIINDIIDFIRGEKTHVSTMIVRELKEIMSKHFQKLYYKTLFIIPIPPTIFNRYFFLSLGFLKTHVWMFMMKKSVNDDIETRRENSLH